METIIVWRAFQAYPKSQANLSVNFCTAGLLGARQGLAHHDDRAHPVHHRRQGADHQQQGQHRLDSADQVRQGEGLWDLRVPGWLAAILL